MKQLNHLICGKIENRKMLSLYSISYMWENENGTTSSAWRELKKVDHSTVARYIIDYLCNSWPDNDTFCGKVLVFISDAVSYMVKTVKSIKVFYSNIIHVTCLIHALYRIAEHIKKTLRQ